DKLNGSLALNETWLKLWGLLSTRPFDAVVGVILLCLLIRGDWQHASLSMLMDKAIHLSDHFPDWERVWEIKDRSKRSFPGDHA
ncbi:phosphoesterase, partial [Pseudomonas aeruginosa]